MSILFLAQASSKIEFAAAVIAGSIAIVIAFALGIFRRTSILGPERVGVSEPISTLWMILLIGFVAWLMIPTVYGVVHMARNDNQIPSTAPASQAITLSPEETVVLGLVSSAAVLLVLVLANVLIRRESLKHIGLDLTALRRAPIPALAGIVIIMPLMYAVSEWTQWFWSFVGLEHPNAHPLLRMFQDESATGLRAMVIVSAIFIAPVFEELLFRGHLQTAIVYTFQWLVDLMAHRPAISSEPPPPTELPEISYPPLPMKIASRPPGPAVRWAAIGITSLMFAFVHPELWMMPPIFLLSLCLGYAYERTGNLWVPILLHATFNSANIALFIVQSRQS